MSVEIWCIGDLNYFVAVLNSLAMIAQSGLFQDLVRLGLILAILVMAVQAVFMGSMQGGLPWGRLIIAWVLFQLMFGTTAKVWVYDTYTLKTMEVDNVPYGVAFAGSVTSKVAHEITEVLEQAFSTPTMLNDGFAAPLQVLLKVRNLSQGLGQIQNGNVQKTLVQYTEKCTSVGINLGQISMENLIYQENPWQAMKFDSGIYTAMTWLPGDPAGGTARTCTDAWNFIDNYLSGNFWDDWNGYLKTVFCDPNDISCDPRQKLQNGLDAMVTVSQNAQYYMMASVLLPVLEQGQINANSTFGKPEMSVIIGQAREQRNAQWVAEGSLFANIVRPLMAFFEGFLYAVTPFMALLVAFVPSGIGLIFKFFAMFIWIQMWMPVMAVLNHYLQIIMQQKLTSLVVDGLIPLTSIQGQVMGMSNINDWMATAGMLASSTPAISLALLYGGAITMTHLAGRLQSGDFVNEKIARPDVVQPGAVVGMQPHQMGGDVYGSRGTGAEAVAPRIEASEVASRAVQSSAAQVTTATQTFREAVGQMAAHGTQGGLSLSSQLQSSSGIEARSGEQYGTTAAYGAMKAHQLGLNQNDTQRLIGSMTGALGAGVSGSWKPGADPQGAAGAADPSQAKTSYGASGMSRLEGQLQSQFGTDRGQQIADSIKSDLNLSGNKSLQAAIDEKMTSMATSGQLRQHQDIFRQDDIANVEKSAQKVEQSQKEFSEQERMASQLGMSQSVSVLAMAKMAAAGGMGMSSREYMMQNRMWLPQGTVEEARSRYQHIYGVTNEEQARWGGIFETMHRQSKQAGGHPGDKLKSATSAKLLMGAMNHMGLMTPATGDASKNQGLVDTGKTEGAADHAGRAAMNLPGPGDVPGGIKGIKGQILPVQGQQEVRDWHEGKAAGIRSQQEEQRMEGARQQYGKTMDDTIREFGQKESWSQSFTESNMGALQGLGSGVREGFSAMVSGAWKFSPKEAQQAWDHAKQELWDHHLQEGKKLGLDDNLSKVYAQGAMHGWSIAAKEHTGLSLPMPKQYEADRAHAVQARSQYLQEQGYSPDAAQHRANQEVFLAEKAGQTGMSNWAARINEGEKLFSQAREARFHMGPTSGNLHQYEPTINQASQRYQVPRDLIRSVIRAESRGNPGAVSPKGARGLMQLMPGTAAGMARQLSADFKQTVTPDMVQKNSYWNIMAGTKYLSQLHTQFGGDTNRALAAYNWGPDNVMRGGRPPRETADYVNKVMGNYGGDKLFRSLGGRSPANAGELGRGGKSALRSQPDGAVTGVGQGPGVPVTLGQRQVETPSRPLIGPTAANAAEGRNLTPGAGPGRDDKSLTPEPQRETGVKSAGAGPGRGSSLPPESKQAETSPRSLPGSVSSNTGELEHGEKSPVGGHTKVSAPGDRGNAGIKGPGKTDKSKNPKKRIM